MNDKVVELAKELNESYSAIQSILPNKISSKLLELLTAIIPAEAKVDWGKPIQFRAGGTMLELICKLPEPYMDREYVIQNCANSQVTLHYADGRLTEGVDLSGDIINTPEPKAVELEYQLTVALMSSGQSGSTEQGEETKDKEIARLTDKVGIYRDAHERCKVKLGQIKAVLQS